MIRLTRLSTRPSPVAVNAELIALVEELPDTVITLTTGDKVIVAEKLHEVIDRVVEYRGRILAERDRALGLAGGAR